MRRMIGLLLGAVVAVSSGAARAAEADAVATVKKIYAGYLKPARDLASSPDQLAPKLYSARRRAQLARLQKACAGKDMCLPDFDHLIDGQDWRLSGLSVTETANDGRTARLDVSFRNFDTAVRFDFTMVKEAGGWKIDEIEGGGGESRYTLDEVFKPNP